MPLSNTGWKLSHLLNYFLTPLPPNLDSLNFDARETLRRTRLLQYLCIIGGSASLVGLIISVVMFLAGTSTGNLISVISGMVGTFVVLASAVLARKGYYSLAAWLLIGEVSVSITTTTILTGYNVVAILVYLTAVLLAIVLFNSTRQIVLFSGLVLALNSWFCLATYTFDFLHPLFPAPLEQTNQLILPTLLLLYPVVVALLRLSSQSQLAAMRRQNERLEKALLGLEERYYTGVEVGRQVQTLAAQLTATASQQASGSTEQLAVVSQIKAQLTELAASATTIAELTSAVNRTIGGVAQESCQIEATTAEAARQTQLGQVAVEETARASAQAAMLYQELLTVMHELSDKNERMQTVLNILTTLAGETHLLALNAAIEAAGAGEYGARFGVVAQEVKNLAARSNARSREVVEIIGEIEGATARALSAAENGYARTQELEQVAGETGRVIGKLGEIANAARLQASGISRISGEAQALTETIKLATRQQHTASEQILSAVSGLGVVAEESARGSSQLSYSAEDLVEVSRRLDGAVKAGAG